MMMSAFVAGREDLLHFDEPNKNGEEAVAD
jgi:hypothetical protein